MDAAPPHPLEDNLQNNQQDMVEIETNLFSPDVEEAAVKIQAGFRGYLARKHIKELKSENEDNEVFNQGEQFILFYHND